MAKTSDPRPRPPSRLRIVGTGVALGAVWGAVMWGIFVLAGREASGTILAYLVISTAMIGGGVAAVFGASNARRAGERVSPGGKRKKG